MPDPLPVPPRPGGYLRPARQRPLRPPPRLRRLHPPRGRRRRRGHPGRGRRRAGDRGGLVRHGRLAHPGRRAPAAGRRAGPDRPGAASPGAGGGALPVRRGARHRPGLGQGEPPLLAARLARLPGMVLLPVLHRAALHQTDRGLRRLGAGHRRRDHPGRLPRLGHQGARPGDGRRPVRPGALPHPGPPRHRGSAGRSGMGGRAGPGARLPADHGRRLRPRAARPRPGQGQPAAARLRRPGRVIRRVAAAALDPGAAPAPAGTVPVLADRARPRPPGPRHRPGAAQAPSRPGDRLAR
jgi:hypothetical protein